MARQVSLHNLEDLSLEESKNEILLRTSPNTELLITVTGEETEIYFPFGNKFDIVGGRIIIKEA